MQKVCVCVEEEGEEGREGGGGVSDDVMTGHVVVLLHKQTKL